MAKKKKSSKKTTKKANDPASSRKKTGRKDAQRSASAHKKTAKKSTKKSTPKKESGSAKRHEPKKRAKRTVKKVARKGGSGGKKTESRKPREPREIDGKLIYAFGAKTEGGRALKQLLGGKGANLAEMTSLGLPVPPGFTITTKACQTYFANGEKLGEDLLKDVATHMKALEKQRGKKFGDAEDPLLVSVRSGAAQSMPGMMDTILNLGLTDTSVGGLAKMTGNERFAYDAYRRLINMFGCVVMGVEHEHFEAEFTKVKHRHEADRDTDVSGEGLKELCEAYKAVYRKHVGEDFPQDPHKQLELAIAAVFGSWNSANAVKFRRIEGMSGLLGTAVNIQSMAFGNMGDDCGTGVAFTRNPSTGKNEFFGEFLVNAQGEDVVAGIRTPKSISEMKSWNKKVYKQLLDTKKTLEDHYGDMQDIEFTVERGELFMLQTRTGKRTGAAAVKIACDMVKEKRIDEKQALLRIPAGDLVQLLLPSFDPEVVENREPIASGIGASPGAAVGHPAFSVDEAVDRAGRGEKVILVRHDTSPEDVEGMHHASGILTTTGGMTSHAAVVARGWGKCCIVGAGAISIDKGGDSFSVDGRTFGRGDLISIDGTSGKVYEGSMPTIEPEGITGDFAKVMRWADKHRTMGVRTNADTPADAARARQFGAEGIGLVRTEHMFFQDERIEPMREMILAEKREDRERALDKLLPFQREDFVGIFTAMKALPVTVRLLDPPLHEFLPSDPGAVARVAESLDVSAEVVQRKVALLHESNPMMGHRGCRLAISYPEILDMQVRAIVEAALECADNKIKAVPEIMIPLVGTARELEILREQALGVIESVKKERGSRRKLAIKIGTMIEIPRACLTADEIAEHADFFSFGTNDLTQMTFGFSRDDAGSFMRTYRERDILPADPFQSLDQDGVGQLVSMGIQKGRATKDKLKIGICGEHGGDPKSVHFCHRAGLDYVSCSPFRVPIARLAAAQAAILGE